MRTVSSVLNIAQKLVANRPTLIMIGRIGSSALSLINAPLIAQALGPEGRGVTAAAIAAFFLVPILLSIGMPLEVRRLAALIQPEPVIRSARVIAALMLPVAFCLGLLVNRLFFDSLSDVQHLILILGVTLGPLMISWMCDESALIARERFRAVAFLQLTQPTINTVLIIIGMTSGQLTVAWVMCANLAGLVATAVVGWTLVKVSLRGPRYSMPQLVRTSLPFSGSSIAEAISNRVDQIIVLPLIGSFSSGLYAVAVTIGTIPIGLAHALGASEFRSIAAAPSAARRDAQQQAVRSSVAVGVVFCLLLAAATPLAIEVLFGQRFYGAITSVWILLSGSVFMIGNYVASTALVAGSSGLRMTSSQAAGATIGIGALILFGPSLGADGASIAATIGYLSTFILLAIAIGGSATDFIPRPADFTRAVRTLTRTTHRSDSGAKSHA